MLGDAELATIQTVAPGDHICVPFHEGTDIEPLVAAFLTEGIVQGQRCLLACSPARADGVLKTMRERGLAVTELTARGALLVTDVDQFYRPTGRHDPAAALATVTEVARDARTAGFAGLRGAGGPVDWATCDLAEQQSIGEYEAKVNEVMRTHGVSGMCLYDQRSAGTGPLGRMLRTHPRVIVDGRLCANPFCHEGSDPADAAQVDWMLRALGQADEAIATGPATRAPLVAEARRMALELLRLQAREAFRAEEVESRNSLLRSVSRQLDPQLCQLEAALAEAPDPLSGYAGDWLERLRESAASLRRLARQLDSASQYANTPSPLAEELGELGALTASTMETWRRSRRIDGTDVRLQAAAPVTGRWDVQRLGAIVKIVLETSWERSWGSPVDLYVEDLGIKARLTAVFEDMEVTAGSPFDATASATLVAAARDSLRVALWPARESARGMGGTLGLSVWPDGRVSVTIDLPRQATA